MKIREVIDSYYLGINQKNGWEDRIGDNMTFNGPKTKTTGKAAYIQATAEFLKLVKSVEIKRLIIEGENACAVANYELVSPNGTNANFDIVEIFTVINSSITASRIFFDTAAFREFVVN